MKTSALSAPASSGMRRSLAKRLYGCLIGLLLAGAMHGARADEFEDGLSALWESLWSQGGELRPAVRWPDRAVITFKLQGSNLSLHRPYIDKAMREMEEMTSLRFQEIEAKDENAEVLIDIVANGENMPPNMGCFVQPLELKGGAIRKSLLRMRDREVYRCLRHEMMHLVGVPGHPSGDSVLSYFRDRSDRYSELDRLLLEVWYSKAMQPGTQPLTVVTLLTSRWAEQWRVRLTDADARQAKFLADLVEALSRFALGQGELPRIILRSGFASARQADQSRDFATLYLGMSYLTGGIVQADRAKAREWFRTCATRGLKGCDNLLTIMDKQAERP